MPCHCAGIKLAYIKTFVMTAQMVINFVPIYAGPLDRVSSSIHAMLIHVLYSVYHKSLPVGDGFEYDDMMIHSKHK